MNPIIPLAALALDRFLGDPPNAWHPVAWQGRFLAWAGARAPAARRETAAMDANASPRKPSVRMLSKSSMVFSLLVA